MKKLVFAALMVAMVGCTKTTTPANNPVVCAIQDSIVSLTSAAVATELACKNLDAVKASLTADAAKLNLCAPAAVSAQKVKAQSAVGDAVCGPVVDALMAGALAQIPASWGCTGGDPADKIKATILAACQKAL